jgi:hypothetical protein
MMPWRSCVHVARLCVFASCAVQMWFNIVGQSVYQLTVLLTIVFHGDVLFNVPSARGNTHSDPPTEHYTIVFTMFVLMQVRPLYCVSSHLLLLSFQSLALSADL